MNDFQHNIAAITMSILIVSSFLFFVTVVGLVPGLSYCSKQDPLVRTVQGEIRGEFLTTYTGKKIYSFRGVRYAEPPTGNNRFKPPVPLKPWSGVYNATGDNINSKIICPQPFPEELSSASGEDCLFLNVYTKELSGKKPVMFFIHPGGYSSLTGASNWFGPEYLLDKNIVLVTINYRLGALGFLSMQDKLLKGNYGMKDQVAALKWVKQNIARFGGNPDKVTIFGYSAGGASVILHMLSPMSTGLFHRAIAMSGTPTMGWAINREPISMALRLGQALGCEGTTPQSIFDCLRQVNGQGISNATIELKDIDVVYPIAFFAPVVEKDYGDGEERFLPDDPWELIKTGQIANVPLITGVTRDEFAYRGLYILENETFTNEFDTNYKKIFPIEFMYERTGPVSEHISQELKKFYFADKPIDNSTKEGFKELYADSLIIFGGVQAAKLLAEKSSAPVYFYMFSYIGNNSFATKSESTEPLGVVAHHDDLLYLFHIVQVAPTLISNGTDLIMVQKLTSMWTEFANTGVPVLPGIKSHWPAINSTHQHYLKITPSLQILPGMPFPKRISCWESLFPISGPHQKYY